MRHRNPGEDVSLDTIVWTLTENDYEGDFTVGIFSTEEKANEYLRAVNDYRNSQGWDADPNLTVEEYELDPDPPVAVVRRREEEE